MGKSVLSGGGASVESRGIINFYFGMGLREVFLDRVLVTDTNYLKLVGCGYVFSFRVTDFT